MNSQNRNSVIRNPIFLSLLVFAGVLILTQYLAYQRNEILSELEREKIVTEVNAVKDRIKNTLGNSLSATRTLAYIVQQHGVPDNFDTVARNILDSNPNIDALQLTRKGKITHIFPMEGNEAAMGYDVLSNEAIREEAQKAIERNSLFFAGPFQLVQGGVAVVGRLPIYKNREFWGFSVVIIKLSTLLEAAGIDTTERNDFLYQLSKVSPVTKKEEFFLPQTFPVDRGELASVEVPDGEWKLYVAHKNDQTIFLDAVILSISGFILSFTFALFAYQLASQPLRLSRLVDERTRELSSAQDTYRVTLERVSDAFVALDRNWRYTYMNRKAGEIFQRDPAAMIGKHLWTEFPEAMGQSFQDGFTRAMEEQQYVHLEEYYPPYDRWFESHVYPSLNGISVYFRDITKNKRAQQRIEASERYFRALIENSSDAIVLLDATGKIVYQSPSTERISGYTLQEVQNTSNYLHVHGDDAPAEIVAFSELLTIPGHTVNRNYRLQHKAGHYIWLEGTYTNLLHDPDIQAVIFNYHDITDRIQAEEKILLEKNLSESTINRLPGVFYLYDRRGKFFRWNKNLEVVSGYSGSEIADMIPLNFFDEDEKDQIQKSIDAIFSNGSAEVEAHLRTKTGRKIPYYFNGSKVVLNHEDYVIGMGIDISDRVEAENRTKERTAEIERLTAHLHRVREEERTHIAREIHDELGQQLTGLKMDATWIAKRMPDENGIVAERMRSMITLIDETIRSVRRIASELRPGILDDLGLVAALEWYSQEFASRTGIRTTFSSGIETLDAERELSINVFRVCQETLTNVARHSDAKEVFVKLDLSDGFIVLTIKDDGVGFDAEEVKTKKSLGLIGMRERAFLFNGDLQIESHPGRGTIVTLTVRNFNESKS